MMSRGARYVAPHTVAIIQARMGSARLPGKVLELVDDAAMLEHVIRRVAQSRLVQQVCVATTTQSEDDAIAAACKARRIACYRARREPNDVVARYLDVAAHIGARVVVRITGDCPLIDPGVIDRVIGAYQNGADYCSNTWPRTYPDGLDVEVFSIATLRKLARTAEGVEREHVTSRVRARPRDFGVVRNVADIVDLSALRWTVDDRADLEFVREVYRRLGRLPSFGMKDVLALGDFVLRTAA